jgi:Zn-dependent metalloprotease
MLAMGISLVVLAAAAAATAAPAAAAAPAPVQVSPDNPAAVAAQEVASLVASRPAYLHASAAETFVQGSVVSSGGLQYVPYQRRYGTLPVVGGDFVMVTNNAGQSVYQSVAMNAPIGTLATTPSLSKDAGAAVAKGLLATVTAVEGTQLVVNALGEAPRLAWESTVVGTGAEGYSRLTVDVDAETGAVLRSQERVMKGTGTGAWNGPSPLTLATSSSGGTFRMTDPVTTNLSCQDAANNTVFSGTDDAWGNGTATNRETGCVDALYSAQTEIKMLSQWLGRNGFNGSGGGWPIRVGLNDQNAYYDGTQVQIGKNTAGQWIGSMDVLGHEMGHGIDDTTPGGISGSGTQEFVADTFGAATEWFANQPTSFDGPDFLVGEKINLVGSGPIRNMYNPSLVGDPNCYSSSVPGSEVHAAAGPGDHWFYLMAMGTNPTNGQPTSPTCNSTTIAGIGIQSAIKIMYNAMLMKTSSSSYLKYRLWTLQAAKNLFSTCAEFNVVKAAWNAVSVPAQSGEATCTGPSALSLANPGSQSSTVGSAASVTLVASGGTTPYTYSASGLPAGLSVNASTGVISGTPTTAGTSSVTATVTDNASPTHATASVTFSWTVSPVGSCSSPGQKLVNPGFESGNTPWTASSGVLGNTSGQTAHGGTKYAWLDGYGTAHTDTLSQSVTLPAGCTSYSLTFWLHIDSAETTTTTQYDKLTVQVGTTTVATFSNLNKATGYTQRTANLSAFAGQTVVLKFTGTEDSSLQTSFVIDDTAITVA